MAQKFTVQFIERLTGWGASFSGQPGGRPGGQPGNGALSLFQATWLLGAYSRQFSLSRLSRNSYGFYMLRGEIANEYGQFQEIPKACMVFSSLALGGDNVSPPCSNHLEILDG